MSSDQVNARGLGFTAVAALALSIATQAGAQTSADGCSLRVERGEKITCQRCQAGFRLNNGQCLRMGDFGTPKREQLPRRSKPIEGIQ